MKVIDINKVESQVRRCGYLVLNSMEDSGIKIPDLQEIREPEATFAAKKFFGIETTIDKIDASENQNDEEFPNKVDLEDVQKENDQPTSTEIRLQELEVEKLRIELERDKLRFESQNTHQSVNIQEKQLGEVEQHKEDKQPNNTEKHIEYARLDDSEIYPLVYKFMVDHGVKERFLPIKLISNQFGKEVIKRLIMKSYLIIIKDEVTVGKVI